jgi:hypothetical protein
LNCNQDLNHALGISEQEKKRNVKKNHQISFENNLIIHKKKETQDS